MIALIGGGTYKSRGKKIIIIYIGIQPVINGIKGRERLELAARKI